MSRPSRISVEVHRGVEGPALYIQYENGTGVRIAGPKAWGGTQGLIAKWSVDVERFRQDIEGALP